MTDETRWGPKPETYTYRDGLQDTCAAVGLLLMAIGIGHFDIYIASAVVGALLLGLSLLGARKRD